VEGLFKRALAVRERALGENHTDVASSLANRANLYRDQGKYGEAEGLYKRAPVIDEKAWSESPRCGLGPQQDGDPSLQ
jgi:hypothetical protein